MAERDPNLIISGLSRHVVADGVTVRVEIYRLEDESAWSLEVVNASGTSIVWDDRFDSDDAANAAFGATVAAEGMTTFLDRSNVVPFRR